MQEILEVKRVIINPDTNVVSIFNKTFLIKDIISIEEADAVTKEEFGIENLVLVSLEYSDVFVNMGYKDLIKVWIKYLNDVSKVNIYKN